jgi:hypothetical protein
MGSRDGGTSFVEPVSEADIMVWRGVRKVGKDLHLKVREERIKEMGEMGRDAAAAAASSPSSSSPFSFAHALPFFFFFFLLSVPGPPCRQERLRGGAYSY